MSKTAVSSLRAALPDQPAAGAARRMQVSFPAAAPGLELELVTSRAAFDALEDDWNALFARAGRSAQVFQTFNWNWHWANHYLGSSAGGISGVELSIVIGRRGGRLVMVWPLVCERVRGVRQIFWMGEPVSQYGDVVIDDMADRDAVLNAGWDFLVSKARGDVVRLRRVRADSLIAPILERSGAICGNRQTAPFLHLGSAPNFAAYEQRYSPRSRRNRKRLMRRLAEHGDVKFERVTRGMRARQLAQTAIELKSRWLADRGLVSHAISDERMGRFFADVADTASRPAGCIVSALTSNGDIAALDVSFACKDRLCLHVIAFNLAFEKSGAGTLLLEQCIRDAFDEKVATLDLMAPGDNYKLDWADASVEVCDWSQPLSLVGSAYVRLYLNLARPRMKAALTSIPQPVRRMLSGAVCAPRPAGHDDDGRAH